MGILGKLFGGGKKAQKEILRAQGEHMPNMQIPTDERFTISFNKNGGKFIYCEDFNEVKFALKNIISENDWQNHLIYLLDKRLGQKFSKEHLDFTSSKKESDIFFTTCEHLIAQDGSILFCSHQIKEKKLNELPKNIIVFATTSQLVDSIGEALKIIKLKYSNGIPDNITTIKNFQASGDGNSDFLSYGSSAKNTYLLLLEDF